MTSTDIIESFKNDHDRLLSGISENLRALVFESLTVKWQGPKTSELITVLWNPIFESVDFPKKDSIPLKWQGHLLTEKQKDIARLYYSANTVDSIKGYAIPDRNFIPRWLGDEPQGLLETIIKTEVNGATFEGPLWLALTQCKPYDSHKVMQTLLLEQQILLLQELYTYKANTSNYLYGINADKIISNKNLLLFSQLKGDGWQWAKDRIEQMTAAIKEGKNPNQFSWEERYFAFECLISAGILIQEEWEILLFTAQEKTKKLLMALPESRRESAFKKLLGVINFDSERLNFSILLLEQLPCDAVINTICELCEKGKKPARLILKNALLNTSDKHARAKLQQRYNQLPPIEELFIQHVYKPEKAEMVLSKHWNLLESAMNHWDGENISLQDRYNSDNPEIRPGDNKTEILELCNSQGKHLFTLVLPDSDSATIVDASENEIGDIVQASIKAKPQEVQDAIELVLATREVYKPA